MSNKNYVKGRNFEYRIIKFLRKLGYYCIRAYASKGLYDVIAVPPKNSWTWPTKTLLIQAKYNGYVPPKELENLKQNDKWEGLPLIAFSKNRKLEFKNLEGVEMRFE